MSYISTDTFLDQLADAEDRLRTLQQEIRDQHTDPQISRILDHFQRTESFMTEVIAEMRGEKNEEATRVVEQFEPARTPAEIFEKEPQSDDAKEWVNWSLKCQQHLAEWCRHLAEKSTSPKVADLFGRLTERLETLNRQLATDTRSLVQK